MSSQVMRNKQSNHPALAKPVWRVVEPVRESGPPGLAWKCLLAAAIVLQAVWIVALVMMATSK